MWMMIRMIMNKCVQEVGKQIMEKIKSAEHDFKPYSEHIDPEVASECMSETLISYYQLHPKFHYHQKSGLDDIVYPHLHGAALTSQFIKNILKIIHTGQM